jgi:UTP--glucose-1-phosphate uridylyltransferase
MSPYESKDKSAMWNPPGHGDIFTAIASSGVLDQLIDAGYKYAFVSNSDNLGATIDTSIPTYMEENQVPFLMEVCLRGEMDKKGGHLCEDKTGNLLLREIAQCPADELNEFQNIELYQYFNTNNLWIDLKALQWHLIANDGMILLPLIINPKEVDGTAVFQLETAMGAAISVFPNSKALIVPRERFAPVKKTTDLLAIWSDAYDLNDKYQITLKRSMSHPPLIELDDRYYKSIDQLIDRFKDGVPSLSGCKKLSISGDVHFGSDVICEGSVELKASSRVHVKNRLLTGTLEL